MYIKNTKQWYHLYTDDCKEIARYTFLPCIKCLNWHMKVFKLMQENGGYFFCPSCGYWHDWWNDDNWTEQYKKEYDKYRQGRKSPDTS